ncbi:MAG: hypothetical protein KIS91_04455 [Anaerolineae bacterium]|nr:hypothetical protein [Anaerolineae bacterium]
MREQERSLAACPAQWLPAYRLPVISRYWNELSGRIAEATQTTVSAIKSRLHRARLMLTEHMQTGERAEAHARPTLASTSPSMPPKGPMTHALRAS